MRASLLLAAFVAISSVLQPVHALAHTRDEVPRWDYWPPLPDRPYFTGRYLASQPGGIHLTSQHFETLDLFALNDETPVANKLLYGSVLFAPVFPALAESDLGVRAAVAAAVATIRQRNDVQLSSDVAVTRAAVFPLKVTGDNGASEMVVLHQYSDVSGVDRTFTSHVTFGANYALTLADPHTGLTHRVVVGLDREGHHNVFQHTFAPSSSAHHSSEAIGTCTAASDSCSVHGERAAARPRILSYNVWNTNPSADVYGYQRRWQQYTKRLDHLARIVTNAHVDIIGFQEVRYDGVFGREGEHAQVQHLAARLPGYQYVYQPAMSYLNARDPYERIEEGPAVFSKHPIVASDYLLLSRDPNDPNDAHQRLCLHAVVDVPNWGLVDVYVTHLSLSERSREQTMVEIWRYMQRGTGRTQVLLGDLNAEPQSRGLQFLRGDVELLGERTDLKDAFLETDVEPEPRSSDALDRHARFTFPSDNPVKRIDFILYRGAGVARECRVIGQAPTDDTHAFPQDVGMLHFQSPVYASDHRGVVAEFVDA